MNKKFAIGVVALVVLVGAAWASGLFDGEDPEVAGLREQLEKRDQLSEQERAALREQMRSLDENQRRRLFEPMMQQRAAEMQTRVYALTSMSEEQRRAELDKWIDDMEKRRRNWEGNGEQRRPPGPSGMDGADRDRRMKGMLDQTTPEMRATMQQMMKMVNKRREERGMQPMRGPR